MQIILCCAVLSHFGCVWLCNPMDCSPLGSSVHGDSPGRNTGVGCHALLQGTFQTQVSSPGLPHCRQILYCQPPGKPKNTGVGSLFLLQGIFLTQRTNPHLLHCRQILYQLSYQQSPNHYIEKVNSVFIIQVMNNHEASQVALVVKNSLQYRNNERMFDPWVGKIPLEEGLANHSSILA